MVYHHLGMNLGLFPLRYNSRLLIRSTGKNFPLPENVSKRLGALAHNKSKVSRFCFYFYTIIFCAPRPRDFATLPVFTLVLTKKIGTFPVRHIIEVLRQRALQTSWCITAVRYVSPPTCTTAHEVKDVFEKTRGRYGTTAGPSLTQTRFAFKLFAIG